MKKHTKIYLKHYNYGEQDFIPCKICGGSAVDIHHIEGRGKGRDVIENLIGLCRDCHMKAHKQIKPYLTKEELNAKIKESL